jgi:hypothetical protein
MDTTNIEKARHEKALADGWFDGNYTSESVELIAEQRGLEMVMVRYWYQLRG